MRLGFWRLFHGLRCMMTLQGGQDLVEYVLLIALLGMSVVAVTKSLAIVLTTALSNIAAEIASDT